MKEKKDIGRRDFIKSGVAGVFGGGIYLSSLDRISLTGSYSEKSRPKNEQKTNVEYRKLGRINFKASLLGFGAMLTREAPVLERALDMGVNYIDTAWAYQKGNNEVMVGKVIKKRRKDVFLVTKGGYNYKRNILKHSEDSLRRLGTDYIDCYLAHGIKKPEEVNNELIISQLEKLKKEGKARYVGFSTHQRMAEVINAAVESKYYDLILTRYSFKTDNNLKKAIERADKAGIAVVAMKVMGGKSGEKRGEGNVRSKMKGLSPFQAALRYVMNNKNIATTIPSMTSFKELEENFYTMDVEMSWSDRKILDKYSRAVDKFYCRGCDKCDGICPEGVNIPDNMRFLMYAEGYGELELGRYSYKELPVNERASKCIDCKNVLFLVRII